jgi:hypothetical protein
MRSVNKMKAKVDQSELIMLYCTTGISDDTNINNVDYNILIAI